MIGAKREAIDMAEDRKLFREAMDRIGLETPPHRLRDQGHDRKLHPNAPACAELEGDELDAALDALENTGTWANPTASSATGATPWPRPSRALDEIGLPAIIRPSFTLGGTGGGIAYNREEFFDMPSAGSTPRPPES
jgi:carbamoyl-phosphate synthase large subunit